MVFEGSSAAISHTGKVRSNNQDSGYCGSNLFVVADGMGGAQAGEVASKAAAESFDRELPPRPPEQVLREHLSPATDVYGLGALLYEKPSSYIKVVLAAGLSVLCAAAVTATYRIASLC